MIAESLYLFKKNTCIIAVFLEVNQTSMVSSTDLYLYLFIFDYQHILENTPKLRYKESRYSEIRNIVNKCQLPQFFIPYTVTI